MRRVLLMAALLALLAPGALWAQGEDVSLEGLVRYVRNLQRRVGANEARLAAIETAIAPTATATPEARRPFLVPRRRIRVMSGPGPNYVHLGWAGKNTRFDIIGKNLAGNWWMIEYEGAAGWVFGAHLWPVSHPERVEVVPTPTLASTNTPQPTATATATATLDETARLVIGRKMNVRSGPGTQYEILGTAEAGAAFEISGRNVNGDWWRIDYEGRSGWVNAAYVTASDADGVRAVVAPTRAPTATRRAISTPMPTATAADPGSEEVIERIMQAVKAKTGATQETIGKAFLLALNDYEGMGGTVRPWGSFFRLPEDELEQRWLYYIPRFEAAMENCGLDADRMFWIVNSNANKLELAGIVQAQGWMPRAEWVEFLSTNEISNQNGLINPCEDLVVARTWEILDQYTE